MVEPIKPPPAAPPSAASKAKEKTEFEKRKELVDGEAAQRKEAAQTALNRAPIASLAPHAPLPKIP